MSGLRSFQPHATWRIAYIGLTPATAPTVSRDSKEHSQLKLVSAEQAEHSTSQHAKHEFVLGNSKLESFWTLRKPLEYYPTCSARCSCSYHNRLQRGRVMTAVPWQLIPVEDAELESIDLRTGASLLGRGQRASPGLNDDCIAKTAARVQIGAGRIQLTCMCFPGFLRILSSESSEAKQLARGQAVLLAVGDIIDFSSVSDMAAPHSRFTYMLAECFPDTHIQVGCSCLWSQALPRGFTWPFNALLTSCSRKLRHNIL